MRIFPLSRLDESGESGESSESATTEATLAKTASRMAPRMAPRIARRTAPRTTPRITPGTTPRIAPGTTPPRATAALTLVDGLVAGPVLIYGSLPPLGSDLDLLALPREYAAIRAGLVAAGFTERHGRFARFSPGQVEVVECAPTSAWALRPDALAALFAEADPLPGMCHLVRPSPHHELLIRARKVAHRRLLTLHQREAIREIAQRDAEAWERARVDAREWHASYALASLRARCDGSCGDVRGLRWRVLLERCTRSGIGPRAGRVLSRQVSRLRYPPIVAFSGLDGAGKTLQATSLRDSLAAAGQEAVIVWKGVGRNRVLGVLRSLARSSAQALPWSWRLSQALDEIMPDVSETAPPTAPRPVARDWRTRGLAYKMTTCVWACLVVLTNVLAVHRSILRAWGRGRILICDRYCLDSVVRLLSWYGDCPTTRLLTAFVALSTPRPVAAFLLDLPAEIAFERKGEWGVEELRAREALYIAECGRLRVARLDATLPIAELSARVAAQVWQALP